MQRSLSRIPGVKIGREVTGEGIQIAVRGLSSDFTRVTLNGNNISVASDGALDSYSKGRQVDLGMFPTEFFSSLAVDKSAKADQTEGGLSGYVNMHTRSAFDKVGQHINYSFDEGYNDTSKKNSPKLSFIYSNTFDDDTVGVLAGIVKSKTAMRVDGYESGTSMTDGCVQNYPNPSTQACATNVFGGNIGYRQDATADYVATHPGVTLGQQLDLTKVAGVSLTQLDRAISPYLPRALKIEGERDSTSELVSLGFKPSDKLSFSLDLMDTQATRDYNRIDNMIWLRRANGNNAVLPANVTVDSTEILQAATYYNSHFWVEARDYSEKMDFKSIMPSMSWQITDSFKMDLSASQTKSTFTREMPTFLYTTPAGISSFAYGQDGVPNFSFQVPGSTFDLNGTSGWTWGGGGSGTNGGARLSIDERNTETQGFHADFSLGEDPKKNGIVFGFSYDSSKRNITALGNSTALANAVLAASPTPDQFLTPMNTDFGANLPGIGFGYHGVAQIDYAKIKGALDYKGIVASSTRGNDASGGTVGDIDETYKGMYIEVNNESEIVGKTLRTNYGMRYADTHQWVGSWDIAHSTELTTDANYGVWLPSFSAVYDAFEDIKIRAAASRTMARPSPSDMFPNASWGSSGIDTINAGNPLLTPYYADGVDFGGEWYFDKLGYVGASWFNKRITGFTYSSTIANVPIAQAIAQTGVYVDPTRQATIAATPGATTNISTKLNAPGFTDIRGQEFFWVQPLDFILNGLGFDFSATHLTSYSSTPQAIVNGIAPWANNITLSYDRDDLSLRLTSSHQAGSQSGGAFNNNWNGVNGPYRALYGNTRTQVDFSASYTLPFKVGNDGNVSVTFDAYNLTKQPVATWFEFTNVPFNYYNPGSTYSLGIHGSF